MGYLEPSAILYAVFSIAFWLFDTCRSRDSLYAIRLL